MGSFPETLIDPKFLLHATSMRTKELRLQLHPVLSLNGKLNQLKTSTLRSHFCSRSVSGTQTTFTRVAYKLCYRLQYCLQTLGLKNLHCSTGAM